MRPEAPADGERTSPEVTTPIFRGRVSETGVLQVGPRFEVWLSTLKGQEVDVVVRKKRNQRTIRQCRYYFGVVLKLISDHTGYEVEELHEGFKLKYLGTEEGPHGLMIPRSTTKLSTKEFIDIYTEPIKRWAAEFLCLRIPDPGEVDY